MKKLFWNRHTKLVLKHAGGWLCLVAGAIMLITPGQGLLTILVGVYLLADEIPFFGRIRAWLQRRFPKTADFVHRHGQQLRTRFRGKRRD
jgi:UPF0716 family protein affecting phage T7 exclusion